MTQAQGARVGLPRASASSGQAPGCASASVHTRASSWPHRTRPDKIELPPPTNQLGGLGARTTANQPDRLGPGHPDDPWRYSQHRSSRPSF